MKMRFKQRGFGSRFSGMLKVDFRRMRHTLPFLFGTMAGGKIVGLSFEMNSFGV